MPHRSLQTALHASTPPLLLSLLLGLGACHGTAISKGSATDSAQTSDSWHGSDTGDTAPDDEICDGIDNDGDGLVDEDLLITVYADDDGDLFGDETRSTEACQAGDGWVEQPGDCDDTNATVYPGAAELCDGIDNDCDGEPEGDICGFHGTYGLENATTILRGPHEESHFGFMLAVGQVDGEGWLDVFVSAHLLNLDCIGGGYLEYSPAPGEIPSDDLDVIFKGGAECYGAGRSLDAGDVNADGLDDVLFGAPYSNGNCLEGAAYLLEAPFDSVEYLDASAAVASFHGTAFQDMAGHGSALGDIDGDCREDVVLGIYGDDTGADSAGAMYVWYSPVSGSQTVDQADGTMYSTWSGAMAGYRMQAGNDFNGDGLGDILAAAPFEERAGYLSGTAYVVFGPVEGSSSLDDADAILVGEDVTCDTGYGLGAGDVNGDGLDDPLVGAILVGSQEGAAYVVYSPPAGTIDLAEADARLGGLAAGAWAGYSLAGGDVDSDGYDDVAMGATGVAEGGCVYLNYGPLSGNVDLLDSEAIFQGSADGDYAGSAVAIADIDQDGLNDLLVAAEFADGRNGSVYIFMNGY